jgi:tRNA (guanine26-N2/guanine27-N2)-dimethyltransferase
MRHWIKKNPLTGSKQSDTSPSFVILSQEPAIVDVNFECKPESIPSSSKFHMVRYQQNPTANWGPQVIIFNLGETRQRP